MIRAVMRLSLFQSVPHPSNSLTKFSSHIRIAPSLNRPLKLGERNCSVEHSSLIDISLDRWRGVSVDSRKHFSDFTPESFRAQITSALSFWTRNDVRVVTLKIYETHASFVPIAVESGFSFHHAQHGYVFLKRWLSSEPDSYPPFANHYLGVAGLVIDESLDHLLVVRERFAYSNLWKLPGGAAENGENIEDVAVREVLEETGVETEFVAVLCFRQIHQFRHGCSDFYFVCHLRPKTIEIKKCDVEIEECRWMNLDEYLKLESTTAMNRFFVECYLDYCEQKKFRGYIGKKSVYHHINKVYCNIFSIHGEK